MDLLILDDFCLHALDATETQDVYEIVVERHLRSSTIVTSNREPPEWLQVMADPLLAQSAIDRLQSAAYELVVEGESYRRRQKLGRKASCATDSMTIYPYPMSERRSTSFLEPRFRAGPPKGGACRSRSPYDRSSRPLRGTRGGP